METRHCEFSNEQIEQTKKKMRTKLFFLLLLKDPNPKYVDKYKDINIDDVFEDILLTFGGFNSLLNNPQIMVSILSKIAGARHLVKSLLSLQGKLQSLCRKTLEMVPPTIHRVAINSRVLPTAQL